MNPFAGVAPGLILSVGEAMLELSPRAEDLWRMGVAGDTLNTAWYLRALLPAAWRVGYASRLGVDGFSNRIADFIAAAGIETAAISRDPARSCGLYAISLHNGERSFTYWRGQSAARHLADDAARLRADLAPARLIYLSGITLAILPPEGRVELLSQLHARAPQVLVVFDPNIRPRLWQDIAEMQEVLTEAAATSDLVLPSFDDEAACFGDRTPEETLSRYLAAGVAEVVVKNGGGAILAGSGSGTASLLPTPLTPVDTTGAGDSFNAGYLAARLTGAGLDAALQQASALAAKVILHSGALLHGVAPEGGVSRPILTA